MGVLATGALLFSLGRHAAHRGGPLLLADGAPLQGETASDMDREIRLNDGSTIRLGSGASFDPMENSSTAVVLRQALGRIDYDVVPGGPRRWTIECGLATVQVLGTSFRVDRREASVRVDVRRGVVLVRSPSDGSVELRAGMHLEVVAPPDPAVASVPTFEPPPQPAASGTTASGPRVVPGVKEGTAAPPAVTGAADEAHWRQLAAQGHNSEAYAELGSDGIARESHLASVSELLSLADVARLSGHPADAVGPLERILHDHREDSHASLAAFTLGEIELRSLGAPAAAARAYEEAISRGIPAGLAEDAYLLLVESLAKAGDPAHAKAAYDRYLSRFPASPRAAEARTWIQRP